MCGIAGIVALDGFDPATLVAMTQLIRYRGPSGYGFAYVSRDADVAPEIHHNDELPPAYNGPLVGLGNRRLAILDVSTAGNQPMRVDGGALCVTYNGEIYNYKELRQELGQLGHRFQTGTDTEVLLRSYQQWGEACLSRFNGMWSFALWDHRRRTLFCARDRFGVKPFYFTSVGRSFYFASEIKQLLLIPGVKRRANPAVAAYFLEWGLQDHSEETIFDGIHQLRGGHALTLRLSDDLCPDIRSYWDLQVSPELQLGEEDAVDGFRELFDQAVKLRLRSDVPVGICLSGGLDSSAILCQARNEAREADFQSFSACFEDPPIDEREYISAAVQAANIQGHRTYPKGESFWKIADTIAYHQDAPIGGTSVFAQWKVMEAARQQNVPVVLGGQGGDESLCGYQKYYLFHLWHLLSHGNREFVPESISWARHGGGSYWTMASATRYLPPLLRRPFSPLQRLGTPELSNCARNVLSPIGPGENLAERQKTDLLVTSLPTLLRHEDRNSMAHSVESRLPFLDYRLVEFAVRCPVTLKLRNGWTKWMLRAALKGTLPEMIRLRKSKLGFNVPEFDWLMIGLRNGRQKLWQSHDLRMARLIDPMRFSEACRSFVDGARSALPAGVLFRALSLEMWARVHQVQ